MVFAKVGEGFVHAQLPVGGPPVTKAFAVAVPGREGALLVTRQDHPRGGFQLSVYAAGPDGLVELKTDGHPIVPFVALDVQEHPLSVDCTDGGVVLTEAVAHKPAGVTAAWDIQRTTYAVDGGEVTKPGRPRRSPTTCSQGAGGEVPRPGRAQRVRELPRPAWQGSQLRRRGSSESVSAVFAGSRSTTSPSASSIRVISSSGMLHPGGLDVLGDLLRTRGADECGGDVVVLQHPGDGQLRHRQVELLGDRLRAPARRSSTSSSMKRLIMSAPPFSSVAREPSGGA